MAVQDLHGQAVAQPQGRGPLQVVGVAEQKPAHPGPQFTLGGIVGVAGLVGQAMVLAVIVHPVLHFALHGDDAVHRRDELGRPVQLTGLVLPDPVQDPDAHIADHQRDRAGEQGGERVPPLQRQPFQREAKGGGPDQAQHAQGGIEDGGEDAGPVQVAPAFRDGDGPRRRRSFHGKSLIQSFVATGPIAGQAPQFKTVTWGGAGTKGTCRRTYSRSSPVSTLGFSCAIRGLEHSRACGVARSRKRQSLERMNQGGPHGRQ